MQVGASDPAAAPEAGDTVQIVVNFVLDGAELRIVLPRRAKFKHLKSAIARVLAQATDTAADAALLDKLHLLHKASGVYEACKDHHAVGGIRNVFVCGIGLEAGGGTTATLSDGEVSEDEPEDGGAQQVAQAPADPAAGTEAREAADARRRGGRPAPKPLPAKTRSAEDALREKAREKLRQEALKPGTRVLVKQGFKSDTGGDQAVQLRKGQRGEVKEVDGDHPGFALIAFEAHASPQWVSKMRFDKLSAADEVREGVYVVVAQDCRSDSAEAVPLLQGQRGRVSGVDQDGDITVAFDDLHQEQWIFRRNLENVRVVGGAEDEPLTLKDAQNLQSELLRGFAAPQFQRELRALQGRLDAGELAKAEFVKDRQDLFLTVQRKILPKYGFEGTGKGVIKMFTSMGPFLKNADFAKVGQEINVLLGLESPPATWKKLADDSGAVVEAAKPHETDPLTLVRVGDSAGAMVVRASAGSTPRAESVVHEQAAPPEAGAASNGKDRPRTAGDAPTPSLQLWPPGDPPPYKMFVVGSWAGLKPQAMTWGGGAFTHDVAVGGSGHETFQLRKGRSASLTIYPSVHASIFDQGSWVVHGPDDKHQGKLWKIGNHPGAAVGPGDEFTITVRIDTRGSVASVHCQSK